MSSFFTLPASQRKRKRDESSNTEASKKKELTAGGRHKRQERDESISGSESEEGDSEYSEDSADESGSEEGETAADRRLKLAERYLENVREEVDDVGFDAAEIDRDLIAERLKEDVVC